MEAPTAFLRARPRSRAAEPDVVAWEPSSYLIDALRKIYTEEPWFSRADAWSSRHDRTASTTEKLALTLENVLGSRLPDTDHLKTNTALILRLTALNLTRSAATLASLDFRPSSSEETIIAAARAALSAIAGKTGD